MSKELNVSEMEALINEILPGLTMYVRDVNLSPELAAKYRAGMIIREKGFTDASNRVMGMLTTHRYAILSNHMGDMREFEHDTNWGLFVAKNNSKSTYLSASPVFIFTSSVASSTNIFFTSLRE